MIYVIEIVHVNMHIYNEIKLSLSLSLSLSKLWVTYLYLHFLGAISQRKLMTRSPNSWLEILLLNQYVQLLSLKNLNSVVYKTYLNVVMQDHAALARTCCPSDRCLCRYRCRHSRETRQAWHEGGRMREKRRTNSGLVLWVLSYILCISLFAFDICNITVFFTLCTLHPK